MLTADKVLSEKELKKLINKLENQKNKALEVIKVESKKALPGEVRIVLDYFLFTLISMTGLRVSEAIKLEMEDLGTKMIYLASRTRNQF